MVLKEDIMSAEEYLPEVDLPELGALRGSRRHGVARFLSVPYAAPPVGDLRWRPPAPPLSWQGVRQDPAKLPRCPQLASRDPTFKGHSLVDCEDCLVLNIWTPEIALPKQQGVVSHVQQENNVLRPVIVYIPGGGGKAHSAHGPAESGLALAREHGACCFHVNYRLGIFGFLAHPELSEEDAGSYKKNEFSGSGNYAILDLIAALRWVQRYASHFGGDPKRVTIWGLSSGAQYVNSLLMCPLSGNLFHRAMMQSCTDLSSVRKLRSSSDIWLGRSAEEWGVELGEALGCPRGEGQLAAMRALSAKVIASQSDVEAATDCYESCIDSRMHMASAKPRSCLDAFSSGDFHRVPVMIGFTSEDGLGPVELEHTMFEANRVTNMRELEALFRREFGDSSAEALSMYRSGQSLAEASEVRMALKNFSCDLWYSVGTVYLAELLTKAPHPPPVFLYRFDGSSRIRGLHGADATFWRGSEKGVLSTSMSKYLANFAKSGNPNGEGLPNWDALTAELPGRYMKLGIEIAMCDFSKNFNQRAKFLIAEYFGKRLPSELRRGEANIGTDVSDLMNEDALPLEKKARTA